MVGLLEAPVLHDRSISVEEMRSAVQEIAEGN